MTLLTPPGPRTGGPGTDAPTTGGAGTADGAPADPERPDAPARSTTLAVLLLGTMAGVQIADTTIASTALAEASSDLGMTGGLQALAASISTFVLAGTVISTGILADRLGRRRVLVAALACAAVGDLLAAASPAPATYLAGRALAGVGLGAVFAAAFAYLRAVVPRSDLAKANGQFAAFSSVALVGLSFLGGALASADWRLGFLVVPAASLLCLGATLVVLPKLPPVRTGTASVGEQLLLAVGVIALLYGVSQAGGGLGQVRAWAPMLAGVVLLGSWYALQRRATTPFFPVELFRNPLFLAAVAVGFVYNFGQAVVVLQSANLWQYLDGFTTTEVSAAQWPLLLAVTVFSFVAGRQLNARMSHRNATLLGGATVAAGFAWLGLAQLDGSYPLFVPGLVLVGLGIGFVQVVFGTLTLKVAPASHLGPVTSAKTTIGQIAYSIGLSVSVILMNAMTVGGVVRRLNEAGATPSMVGEGLDAIRVYTTDHTAPTTEVGRRALGEAVTSYGRSFTIMMLVFAGVLLVLTVAAAFLLRGEHREKTRAPAGDTVDPSAPSDPATAEEHP
jgi:MFS family permease